MEMYNSEKKGLLALQTLRTLMKTLPSPPLPLPLSTFLLFAFRFTATALPSLLLFGYREVVIGVIIDKLLKLASFLRTLRPKETTVSYLQVVTAPQVLKAVQCLCRSLTTEDLLLSHMEKGLG